MVALHFSIELKANYLYYTRALGQLIKLKSLYDESIDAMFHGIRTVDNRPRTECVDDINQGRRALRVGFTKWYRWLFPASNFVRFRGGEGSTVNAWGLTEKFSLEVCEYWKDAKTLARLVNSNGKIFAVTSAIWICSTLQNYEPFSALPF